MKKYSQADYMCDLARLFLEHENKLTNQQKNDIIAIPKNKIKVDNSGKI